MPPYRQQNTPPCRKSDLPCMTPAYRQSSTSAMQQRPPQLWQRWLGPVDGLEQEYYLSFSTRPNAVGRAWSTHEDEVSSCTTQHKSCWFHAGRTPTRSRPRPGSMHWRPICLPPMAGSTCLWEIQRQALGAAPGAGWSPERNVSDGAYCRRYFKQGIAIINPTMSTLVVPLDGTYLNNGRPVHTITLRPANVHAAPWRRRE